MNKRKITGPGRARESVEWIEVEVRGELLEFLRGALTRGAYESKQELLRYGVRRLKEGRDKFEYSIKKAIKESSQERQ